MLKSKLFNLLIYLIYYNSIILCLIFTWIIIVSNLWVRLLNNWVLFISQLTYIYIADLRLTLDILLNFKHVIFRPLVLRFLLVLIINYILRWLYGVVACLYLNKHILCCEFLSFDSVDAFLFCFRCIYSHFHIYFDHHGRGFIRCWRWL